MKYSNKTVLLAVTYVLPFTCSCKWLFHFIDESALFWFIKYSYLAGPHHFIDQKNSFFWLFCDDSLAMSDLLNTFFRMLRVMWQLFYSHIISGVILPLFLHTGVQGSVHQARQTTIFITPMGQTYILGPYLLSLRGIKYGYYKTLLWMISRPCLLGYS